LNNEPGLTRIFSILHEKCKVGVLRMGQWKSQKITNAPVGDG
jgi:hypothetical protein